MINNKFLLAYFISVADNTAEPSSLERSGLHVICFFIKIIKMLENNYNFIASSKF